MHVSPAIGARWKELSELTADASVSLLVVSDTSVDDAFTAAQSSATAAVAAVEAEMIAAGRLDEDGDGEASPGCLRCLTGSDGVVILVWESPEDFDGLIRELASSLGAAGIVGSLELYEAEEWWPAGEVSLFECRLRVAGRREGRFWRADQHALERTLERGVAWCCSSAGSERPRRIGVGGAWARVTSDDDPLPHLKRGIRELGFPQGVGSITLLSVTDWGYRIVSARGWTGGVVLVDVQAQNAPDSWRNRFAALRSELSSAADSCVYGFVKLGRDPALAVSELSVRSDWPVVKAHSLEDTAPFEAAHAPDAFGLQLLGADYAGRGPTGSSWQVTRLANQARLLEHNDPVAWFTNAFQLPAFIYGVRSPDEVPPSVLNAARRELAPLLLTQAIVDASC